MRTHLIARVLLILLACGLLAACLPAAPQASSPTPETIPASDTPLPTAPAVETPPLPEETITPPPAVNTILPETTAWSPDSRWLAYADSAGGVWLLPASGEPPVHLAEPVVQAPGLAWLPDASLLVWDRVVPTSDMEAGRPASVYRLTLDKGGSAAVQEQALLPFGEPGGRVQHDPLEVVPSPDGSLLAFTSGGELWLYSLQDQSSRVITRLAQEPLTAAGEPPFDTAQRVIWSPDGSLLAVQLTGSECPSPCSGTAVLDRAGEEIRLLAAWTYPLGWSADGQSVLARNTTGDWSQGYTYDCYGLPAGGGVPVNLTRTNPAYDQLLDPPEMYQDSPYQVQNCRQAADGSLLADLVVFTDPLEELPDTGFIRIHPGGERDEYLPSEEGSYTAPFVLANGELIYTHVSTGAGQPIFEVFAGGQSIQSLPAGEQAAGPYISLLSPDQRWLAVLARIDQPPVLVEIP